jgi:hypothetical protein
MYTEFTMIGFNPIIGGNPASSSTGQTRWVADDFFNGCEP